ncbi:MAG: hypothetical protein ACREX3_13810 [Gammaproteobacteria bacterium]
MIRLLLAASLACALLGGCSRPGEVDAGTSPADQPETVAGAPASSAAAPADVAASPEATSEPAAADKAVNDSIDAVLGDHAKYETVIRAYQKAVADGDKAAIAALVDYPFSATIDGRTTSIKDAADFVKHYDSIVTPEIARVVKAQEYSGLMVSGKGVMFGSGETWINGICAQDSADCSDFDVKVVAIGPGAE